MVDALFSWQDWDMYADDEIPAYNYINCTLKTPLGRFSAGDTVDCIEVSYAAGTLGIYDKQGELLEEVRLGLYVKTDD